MNMFKSIKNFGWVGLLVAGMQPAWGFALLGPTASYPGLPANFNDGWQTALLGYDLAYLNYLLPGGPVTLGDIGGPKNIGEEYRRNAPVIYYTYDANFIGFFGSNGMAAADSAFAIMNSLTNVSSYSSSLSEFPLQSHHFNFRAQSLYLTDLKSVTLHLLVEQLGLAEPERYTWTLHDRDNPPGCPLNTTYIVVQRNFDIINSPLNQVQYSPYVNNLLYTYYVYEDCDAPPLPSAFTVPYATDPLAEQYSAVAANNFSVTPVLPLGQRGGGLQIGGFYTGLTRDDVAGLRYLLRTNNVNWETPATGSQLFIISTNFSTEQLFPNGPGTNATGTNASGFYYYDGTYGYGDLRALLEASKTNGPAVLQAMYPGLVISSVTNYFVMASNATVTAYFTSGGIGSPYGTIKLVTVTNYTPYLLQMFTYKFANIFTNHYYSRSVSYLQSITVGPNYGSPYPGVPTTNTTSRTLINTKVPSGDFFVLPMFQTNVCPLNILYTGLTNVTATTNFITSASTNVVTATNTSSYSFTQILVTYFTNYTFVIRPVTCGFETNSVGLYQGIENVKFVRADFDSLIGQFFQPVTNNYRMVFVTNSQPVIRHFQRVITQPDILLTARDLAVGPAGNNFNGTVTRGINFDVSTTFLNGLAGPGVINSPTTFTYNKVGAAFWNGPFVDASSFISTSVNETTQTPSLLWASFDASTNDPVVYPNGTSIANLENQVLVQVSPVPPTLPDGTHGVPYAPLIFTAAGGAFSPPFTWSASTLPTGLALSSGGTLSGTPAQSGAFDFTIQLTDSLSRSVQWSYSIIIH